MNNLALPNLDDRRWTDLFQEGLALVPFYAPGWTDHNVSDPGITLVDLFAWLAEMDIYQLNRIPARHRLKFLALAGLRPSPPQAARSVFRFSLATPAPQPPFPCLPAGVELETFDAFGTSLRFRSLSDVTVVPGQIQSVQRKQQGGLRGGYQDLTRRWQRGEAFLPFGEDPQPGAVLYLGLDTPLPVGDEVSFYLSFTSAQAGEDERRRLLEEQELLRQACCPPPGLVSCAPDTPPPAPSPYDPAASQAIPPHHSATIAWEFLDDQGGWRRLDALQVQDDTRALTLNGTVRVRLPSDMGQERLGQAEQPLAYLRCLFVSGAFDAAPEISALAMNAVPAEQAVFPSNLTWVVPGTSGLPGFQAELLGQATVAPGQVFTTSENPLQEDSFELYTFENGRLQAWERRPDFDASAADERHYLLDAALGQVTFGDGQTGRIPPVGVPVLARYRATRAEAGNLAAGASFRLADSALNHALLPDLAGMQQQLAAISNLIPGWGGAAAERLEHAEGRAFELAAETQRAVTLDDIQALAKATPGVRLARAWAQANHHPAFACYQAPGVITLVVLPTLPLNRPVPSQGLLRRVASYVSRRRVIGTRLEVVGPVYVEVTVRAVVQPVARVSPTVLQAQIMAALERFFHPLLGGPDGTGWPFGRDVYRSEVLQLIDEIPGVDHVVSLELIANGGEAQCANLCVGPLGLVVSGKHQIQIGGENGGCNAA